MYEEGNTPYDWLIAAIEVVKHQEIMVEQITEEFQKMAKLQRDTVVQQQRLIAEIIKLRQIVSQQDQRLKRLESQQ